MTSTDVQVGQTWADNDKRAAGRRIRVDRIEDGKAVCTVLANRSRAQEHLDRDSAWFVDQRGRTTRIALSRFRPTSTGYRLVLNADGTPAEGGA